MDCGTSWKRKHLNLEKQHSHRNSSFQRRWNIRIWCNRKTFCSSSQATEFLQNDKNFRLPPSVRPECAVQHFATSSYDSLSASTSCWLWEFSRTIHPRTLRSCSMFHKKSSSSSWMLGVLCLFFTPLYITGNPRGGLCWTNSAISTVYRIKET